MGARIVADAPRMTMPSNVPLTVTCVLLRAMYLELTQQRLIMVVIGLLGF